MMRRLLLAATAVVAVAAPLAVVASPANAATNPPCITRAEYGRIHHGQTLTKVRQIVGGSGRITLGSAYLTIRTFKTCTPWHVSNVSLQHGRVTGKLYI